MAKPKECKEKYQVGLKNAIRHFKEAGYDIVDSDVKIEDQDMSIIIKDDDGLVVFIKLYVWEKELPPVTSSENVNDRNLYESFCSNYLSKLYGSKDEPPEKIHVRFDRVDIGYLKDNRALLRHIQSCLN